MSIVELLSLLVHRNKSYFRREAIPMNQNDVLLAVRQRGNNVQVIVSMATGHGRCSRQLVPSVAKIPRCHLNPALTDQSIAAIATTKSE